MKIRDENGEIFLDPGNTKVSDLILRLDSGDSLDSIRVDLGVTDDNHWRIVLEGIFKMCERSTRHPRGNDLIVVEINREIAKYALAFPIIGTVSEAKRILEILRKPNIDLEKIEEIVFRAVMDPRIRAVQLVGRFLKIDIFMEFAYFINAGTLSYYRGNVAAAFLTLIPTIEGVILRWIGYPSQVTKKPDFEKIKNFIGNTIYRNPTPLMPNFIASWIEAADEIFTEHLYKPSTSGAAQDDFNRHLALHMLDKRPFYSHNNVMRAFLLLDILTEVYICEKRLVDHRWEVKHCDEKPYIDAYLNAISQQSSPMNPEAILSNHSEHPPIPQFLFCPPKP